MQQNHHEHWEISFEHHKYPCFITDKDSGETLFYNQEFARLYDLKEDFRGKHFYDFIDPAELYIEQPQPDWEYQSYFESDAYDHLLNMRFMIRSTLFAEYNTVFCEMIPTDTDTHANNAFDQAISRCMEIYSQPSETILISFMELLCHFYDCERAYVYRFHTEQKTINCVSQWCKDPAFHVAEEVGTKMDADFLMQWINAEHESGIVMADVDDKDFDLDSTLAKIMFVFKMKNIVLCTVNDADHNVTGVVGLSNRKDCGSFFDRRLINTISRFVAQDVSKGQADDTLFHLHHRDSLTGLFNRAGYSSRTEHILSQNPSSMGVISANLNGLRFVNKTAGTAGGDLRIKAAAKRISDHFDFDIYRMSGDEFLGVAPNVSEDAFESQVRALHTLMKQEGNDDFALGHAWASGHFDLNKLSLQADAIMYINKQEYYANSERSFDSVSDTTLSDLLSYLEQDEFMIYLQPQVRLKDSSLYGAEALIRRFDKKNQKMVFPDQFISLYEQKSVIRHVDLFVVDAVCRLISAWDALGKAIPISVNLSRVTLQEYGIVDSIVDICDRHNVPHHLLVIEVTERVGLIENNVASALVTSFKNQGFHISLDDFGCAYSNIVTLAQIEVDEVKLDKSLVDDLTSSKKNQILVKNVLCMCNELEGASTLAEGIEEAQQAELLMDLGCHLGQGYFYSRPLPVAQFEETYLFGDNV